MIKQRRKGPKTQACTSAVREKTVTMRNEISADEEECVLEEGSSSRKNGLGQLVQMLVSTYNSKRRLSAEAGITSGRETQLSPEIFISFKP